MDSMNLKSRYSENKLITWYAGYLEKLGEMEKFISTCRQDLRLIKIFLSTTTRNFPLKRWRI
jgi:hypothetical protein